MMNERERLVELLQKGQKYLDERDCDECRGHADCSSCADRNIADYLLENGVVVLPCKVGDRVWINYDNYTTTGRILAFYIDGGGWMVDLMVYTKEDTVIGNKSIISKDYTIKDIFLTKEEAEQALKGGAENEL